MKKKLKLSFILLATCLFSMQSYAAQKLTQRKDVKAFVQMMITKHHFQRAQVEGWLNEAKIQPDILKTIAKPAEGKPWHQYEPIFLTEKRINDGVAFWRQHEKALLRAEKEYGVPPEVIVAIIGVETFYGQRKGQYNVLDSLVTLGFNYPPRSKFFLSELEQFLLLAREEHWDPKTIKGSYAGAMGNPQFISSSYRRFAVDFNHNGKRDLINNVDDSIGSVANYFKLNGWKPNTPVAFRADARGKQFEKLIASKANPTPEYSLKHMSHAGVKPKTILNTKHFADQHFALLALENKAGNEYWLGANNFYVITRYNHSTHYAMAVHQLSQKLRAGYQA